MTLEDRKAIVATVEETYALMGRALSTEVPSRLMPNAIRPDVMRQIFGASVDPYVTDEEMLPLLRLAYFDLVESVLRIREELVGPNGNSYETKLQDVGLTASGREEGRRIPSRTGTSSAGRARFPMGQESVRVGKHHPWQPWKRASRWHFRGPD
jgi:hypothetical protein